MKRKILKLLTTLAIALSLFNCSNNFLPEANIQNNSNIKTGHALIGGEVREVTYEVIDGLNVYEGDIIIPGENLIGPGTSRSLVKANALWPGKKVYYQIDSTVYNKQAILDAIDHWEEKTALVFIEKAASTHIRFIPHSKITASSSIGKRSTNGIQYIYGADWAGKGEFIHEIGHAVGLEHEHSRADRDQYIDVFMENVESGKEHNFNIRNTSGHKITGTFDFGSIMLYHSWAFAKDGTTTLLKKDGSTFNPQRSTLSKGDISGIKYMYSYDWSVMFSENGSAGAACYDKIYIGDFDGDGAEELLGVSNSGWMTMSNYVDEKWNWGWSNYGSSSKGSGIYDYRNNMIAGDFDGDGKDELMGIGSSWITMFHFDNGDWRWGWSNYGNSSKGGGIFPYRYNLIAGDYDGDGKDELMGMGDWMTMFHYDGGDWKWGWSNYGDSSKGSGIYPYRNNMVAGDYDGDGKDELIGLGGWCTMFHYDAGDWKWGWSTYGNSFAGWTYSTSTNDFFIAGDFEDGISGDEGMFFQRYKHNGWSTLMTYKGGKFNWTWSNYGDDYVDSWLVKSSINAEYYAIKAVAGKEAYILARRKVNSKIQSVMIRKNFYLC